MISLMSGSRSRSSSGPRPIASSTISSLSRAASSAEPISMWPCSSSLTISPTCERSSATFACSLVARVILVGSTRLASSSWISVLSASNLCPIGDRDAGDPVGRRPVLGHGGDRDDLLIRRPARSQPAVADRRLRRRRQLEALGERRRRRAQLGERFERALVAPVGCSAESRPRLWYPARIRPARAAARCADRA